MGDELPTEDVAHDIPASLATALGRSFVDVEGGSEDEEAPAENGNEAVGAVRSVGASAGASSKQG